MMMTEHETDSDEKIIYRVSRVSIYANTALAFFKLFAGIFGHSAAMISDAVHSFSDMIGTAVVMIGAKISGRSADRNHPYGHDRFECVASILVAGILVAAAAGIGWGGLREILHPDQIQVPTLLPLAAAVISIVSKEGLYHYTIRAANKINSVSLKAEAWDHRSDAISSIGSLAGIGGALLGMPILDPICAILIAIMILRVAYTVFRETIDKMVDTACPAEEVAQFREEVASVPGVIHIDDLRTRQFGANEYVDVDITARASLTLEEAHEIAKNVHNKLESCHPRLKHCMVHVNPDTEVRHEDGVSNMKRNGE